MRLLNIPKMYKKEWQVHTMANLMLILNFDVYIKFNKECDNDSIKSYDQFDSKMYDKYGEQIIIHYPWDEVK